MLGKYSFYRPDKNDTPVIEDKGVRNDTKIQLTADVMSEYIIPDNTAFVGVDTPGTLSVYEDVEATKLIATVTTADIRFVGFRRLPHVYFLATEDIEIIPLIYKY